MKHFDVRIQVFGSNEGTPSCDETLNFVLDSESHHAQLKIQTAPVPSRSAKTQASFLVAKTNTVRSTFSWQEGSPQE